jgi:hypothetical protein
MVAYNLDHEGYCAALGHCECTTIETRVVVRKPAPGIKIEEKPAPPVLTLRAREVRCGLPDAILAAESIQSAIGRGHIRVMAQVHERFGPGGPQ